MVTILTMTAILAIGAIYLASAIPAYGMTTAAFLVFFGALNYVAYRDTFERRSENFPNPGAGLSWSAPVRWTVFSSSMISSPSILHPQRESLADFGGVPPRIVVDELLSATTPVGKFFKRRT